MPIRAWFPTFIYSEPLQAAGLERWNAELADDSIVKDADTAGCDGSHSQFFVTGYAELSDDKHIEGRV